MNVTVELIAWNATNGPAVSHSSVYTIGALGSKQFLTFDLKDTLQEAGAKPSDLPKYFVQIKARSCTSFSPWQLLHRGASKVGIDPVDHCLFMISLNSLPVFDMSVHHNATANLRVCSYATASKASILHMSSGAIFDVRSYRATASDPWHLRSFSVCILQYLWD